MPGPAGRERNPATNQRNLGTIWPTLPHTDQRYLPWLRAIRRGCARVIGATVAACPVLEPLFVKGGRAVTRRSHLLATQYWFAQDDLIQRLRASGRRFRRLRVADVEMFVDVTDGTGRPHYFHDEPYEPQLSAALAAALQRGDVFIDVGANIGYFSVLAARLVGETGRVIAIEPHPDAVAGLRAGLAINDVSDRVDVVEAAAGRSHGGSTRLFLSIDSVLSTTDPSRAPLRAEYPFDRAVDVPQIAIDTHLAAHPGLADRIAAIKIDVEGTEDEVLAGMRATRAHCPTALIICETEPGSAADVSLRGEGYTATSLELRGRTFGNYLYRRPQA